MAGNENVDITVGNAVEGSNPLWQFGILCGFILLGLIVCCCCLRGRMQFVSQAIRQVLPPTQAEREARQNFVDKHLVVQEWSRSSTTTERNNNNTVSVKSGGTDVEDVANGAGLKQQQQQHQEVPDDDDHHHDECPICLTAYNEGDQVSPSTNESCGHVFHQECVYEWLLKRKECPMCRNVFLLEPTTEDDEETPNAHGTTIGDEGDEPTEVVAEIVVQDVEEGANEEDPPVEGTADVSAVVEMKEHGVPKQLDEEALQAETTEATQTEKATLQHTDESAPSQEQEGTTD